MSAFENLREDAAGVVALLVLSAGFLALFAGYSWFWMVWVVGFAVTLPLVAIATGDGKSGTDTESKAEEPMDDPLDRLRERYAAGELTEEEFEHRLKRLLETEDDEPAAAYVDRTRREREHDREGPSWAPRVYATRQTPPIRFFDGGTDPDA